jgi:hypothetical protein
LTNSSIRAHQEYCRDIDPLNFSGPESLLLDRGPHLLPGLWRDLQQMGDGIGGAGGDAAGVSLWLRGPEEMRGGER